MRTMEDITKTVANGETITQEEWAAFLFSLQAKRITDLERAVEELRCEINSLRSSDMARSM